MFSFRRTAAVIVCGATLSLAARALDAQPSRARVRPPTDSLVKEALGKAELGDTSTALNLLERATDQSPRDADALYWRGLILSRTTALSLTDTPRRLLAEYLIRRANDIDPKNPRYLIELGRIRLKTPLLRVEAERMFRKALSIAEASDSPAQLADVAYELGTIKERRYLTGRNRYLYNTTNVIFDPIAARARLHYTREFLQNLSQPIENSGQLDAKEAEEYFRRALTALPSHAPSALSLMGLLYDQQRYDEMRATGAPFLALDSAPARVLFASALAAYRLGQLAQSDSLFNRALARFSPADRAEITHLGRITRVGDSVRIDGLSQAERLSTDSAFWEAADPLLSTPQNEARLEFLARMAYTDLRFSDADMRQVGWRTDRGLIIARYGEPPVVATFPPTSDADAKDAVGRVITVWYYPRSDVEFVFTGPPAMNVAFFAGNHRGYAEEQRQEAPFLLDNLALALAVDSIAVQMARFRGPTAATTQLLMAAEIPAERLYKRAELDRGALEASVRVGAPSATRVTHIDTMDVKLPAKRVLPRLWVDTVDNKLREIRARVEVRDGSVQSAVGRAQVDMGLFTNDVTTLGMSDLLFADRHAANAELTPQWNRIGLVPRGSMTLAQRDTFSVYWENYGLKVDANDRVKYEVRILVTLEQIDRAPNGLRRFFGGISDVVGLSPEGDETLGLRFERNAPLSGRDRVPELVTLGLGTAPAGRYRMELIITDRNSTRVARSARVFHIRREQ